jgi:Ca2+-binding EF-hand superfamily protein
MTESMTYDVAFTEEEIDEILADIDPDLRGIIDLTELIEIRIASDGHKQYRIKPEYSRKSTEKK